MFESFQTVDVDVGSATIHAKIAGDGPPLLLLHGYPQTHAMWANIAPELAKSHRVVVADLRGYGASLSRNDDYSFRAMAADQVELMRALGHDRFDVVAHDRGARVTHRMALDHPDAVRSVALLDILPTLDVWRLMDDWLAMRYYHWMFLAQPAGMPERLINGDPIGFLHSALRGLSAPDGLFSPEAMSAYEAASRKPSVVAAWCGDYRAGATIDPEHDRADLGRACEIPCLILWGAKGVVARQMDPIAAWRTWFPAAQGHAIDAGHFLAEERPADVLSALKRHLGC